MILADTSIWVDHFRSSNARLSALLESSQVVCHPFVIGELACGRLRRREEILGLLATLPSAAVATHQEALALIDERGLDGQGLGWIDVNLLSSSLLSGCRLWTADKALARAARSLDIDA